jgi:lipoprotein-anchoring transpeptidase ErfK/SrfK
VDFDEAGLHLVEARDGVKINWTDLRAKIETAIEDPSASHRLTPRTKYAKAKVRLSDLAAKYPTLLVVSRERFKLTLYKNLKKVKTYGIAVGRIGLETPAGLYRIQNKAINPAWHVPNSKWAGKLRGKVIPGGAPNNPLKARWLGIYDGVGIHGTGDPGSIGSNASHGCIRMRVPEVEELYDEVPVGTQIYIS